MKKSMTVTESGVVPLWTWTIYSAVGLLFFIVNCIILRKELKKRKSENAKFASLYLRIFSFTCMISGVLIGFSTFTQFMPGFCYFGWNVAYLSTALQGVSRGFFQLCRLYYCFAKSKVYTNKGYSNRLFIIMFIIYILWY